MVRNQTLDGNGHTITAWGEYFQGRGVIRTYTRGTKGHIRVRNLTIEGPYLVCNADFAYAGIHFISRLAGSITDVTIHNHMQGDCSWGIDIVGGTIDITRVTITGATQGISYKEGISGTIADSTVHDASWGIVVESFAQEVAIIRNTITDCDTGISVGTEIESGSAHVTDNTVTGRNRSGVGILLRPGEASVSENVVSNMDCGIWMGSATASVENNAFPTPPGNRRDIC